MKDELIFTKSYINKRSNGANKAYWTKYVAKYVNYADKANILNRGIDTFDDEMPIFTFISLKLKRGLVIYQYNPSLIDSEEDHYSRYITAWTQRRIIEDTHVSLLTIYILPTSQNTKIAKILIANWFKKKSIKTLIEDIYRNQESNFE